MPNQFNLTSGSDTLSCDIAGNVTKGGAAFGTWSVTKDNQISILPTGGAATPIPVSWSFNSANELVLAQPATPNSFNFFADAGVDPQLTTALAVLTVQPDVTQTFSFELRPTWKIEANFDMTVTISGVISKIDGIVGDAEDSSFDYVLQTTGSGAIDAYRLNFTGKWEQQTAGNADLKFDYDKEADATGSKVGTFDLPDGLGVDSTRNILVYRANKNDQSSTIALIGTLNIRDNFHITYELESSTSAGVQSSHFHIEADLVKSSIGNLTLQLDLKKSAGLTRVEIAGQYQGVIAGANLTVGFTFVRQVQGQQVTQTVGFQGKVQLASGNTFQWAISVGQGTVDISAHVSFAVGTTCAQAALNFHSGGGQVAVTAMFSISTNCKQVHA
jgi:hypothetical protein